MLNIKNYVRAQSLEEAFELNKAKTNIIIGGMMWLRMGSRNINTAIDLCDLGLDKIEENEEEFSIGAYVTLRQLETHKELNEYSNGIIRDCVKDIVGVQFRNGATVGGSIYGRFGFSDVLTAFLAMDTYVELYDKGIVSLDEFSSMKKDNDILVRIIIKKKPGKYVYSTMRNTRTDFPVLTCAVSEVDSAYKAVIGARSGKAVVVNCTKELFETPETCAEYVSSNVSFTSNIRGSAEYRKHICEVLMSRNLAALKEI